MKEVQYQFYLISAETEIEVARAKPGMQLSEVLESVAMTEQFPSQMGDQVVHKQLVTKYVWP